MIINDTGSYVHQTLKYINFTDFYIISFLNYFKNHMISVFRDSYFGP